MNKINNSWHNFSKRRELVSQKIDPEKKSVIDGLFIRPVWCLAIVVLGSVF